MKRIVTLLALILVPALSFAQTNVIQNEAGTSYAPNAGNINSNVAVDRALRLIVSLSAGTASANNPIILEDSAFPDLQALVAVGVKIQSALTVDAATNDAGSLKAGLDGRLITTLAPAGETGTSCSADETGTASRTILGAVASNRWYVTSINCSNNSAVASRITFLDGASERATGGVGALAVTGGDLQLTFNPPIRGSVNTAFNFQPTTTATATRCCATAYYSVN
jgi:hypothetical protein